MSEIKPVYRYRIFDDSGWIYSDEKPKDQNIYVEIEALYPAAAYEALENERDELKQSLDDLQERFNGIKFIESELRKELEEFEVERNRREEMRKALEAQMGISNKWQS